MAEEFTVHLNPYVILWIELLCDEKEEERVPITTCVAPPLSILPAGAGLIVARKQVIVTGRACLFVLQYCGPAKKALTESYETNV